jgi:copper resistance protein C
VTTVVPTPRPSRLRALLAVLAAALCLVLGTATAASAHTALESSNPAEGSTVTAPLPAVDLTFSGAVLVREVTVTGPDGAPAVAGAATAAGGVVTQPVALAAAGTYTVGYAVTSSDGHPVEGTVSFTYAPPPPPAPTTAAAAPTTATAAPETPDDAAEPAEAAAERSTGDPSGIPLWIVLTGAAAVVVGAVLAVRRLRSRS